MNISLDVAFRWMLKIQRPRFLPSKKKKRETNLLYHSLRQTNSGVTEHPMQKNNTFTYNPKINRHELGTRVHGGLLSRVASYLTYLIGRTVHHQIFLVVPRLEKSKIIPTSSLCQKNQQTEGRKDTIRGRKRWHTMYFSA